MSKEQKSYKTDGRRTFIRTFGCQMNDADSEVMERLLEREGYGKIDSPEEADVIIFNKKNWVLCPRN